MDCENKENLRKCNMSSTDPIEEFREDHRRVGDGLLDMKVKLTGACGGCPMSDMTLKMGVERQLIKRVSEIKEVVSLKDNRPWSPSKIIPSLFGCH